jgi:Ca-activated chloride channel family protein
VLRLVMLASVCILASGAEPSGSFRAGTNLALVDATVVDRHERFIPDLDRSDFRVFERGAEQHIKSFALEDAPISIAIVLDSSGSMKRALPLACQAVRAFLQTANPDDEFSVVTVRDRPEISLEFVRRSEDVLARMETAAAGGETALLDSVYLAASYLGSGVNKRKAILVISDGEDNHSRYTEAELVRLLRECGSTLYAIRVGIPEQPAYVPDGFKPKTGADILNDLAEETGGRYFETGDARELPGIMSRLDIRYQYVLGFAPDPREADGKYHRVDVKLSRRARSRHLQAYWRPGYYAPLAFRPVETGTALRLSR